jgi:hypothetical protein
MAIAPDPSVQETPTLAGTAVVLVPLGAHPQQRPAAGPSRRLPLNAEEERDE